MAYISKSIYLSKEGENSCLFIWEGQWSLWEVHILTCKWCLFQMIGSDSHDFHDQSENHWGVALCDCSLWSSEKVVSDIGPQLASKQFAQFMKQIEIKVTRIPPYHPASHGAFERSVKTTKVVLAKQVLDVKASKFSLEHRLANFLILYHSTSHTVTGKSPA